MCDNEDDLKAHGYAWLANRTPAMESDELQERIDIVLSWYKKATKNTEEQHIRLQRTPNRAQRPKLSSRVVR